MTLGAGDCMGEKALLVEGGTRTASIQADEVCQVMVLHRSAFTSMMRNGGLNGVLVFQPGCLSRLLTLPPGTRSEVCLGF